MADEPNNSEQPSTSSNQDELEARLDAFDARVKAAGHKSMPEVPEWNFQRKVKEQKPGTPTEGDGARSLGIGMTAAYALVGGMLAGFGAGWLIDKRLGSSPLWAVVLGLGGTIFSLVYVFILISRENK